MCNRTQPKLPQQAQQAQQTQELLSKLQILLDEAMYLMENNLVKPDENDHIWFTINDAHSFVRECLNETGNRE